MGKLYCCVPSCLSTSGTGVHLHRIPSDKRQQYANLIQRSNNWIPNVNSRICEKHFAPDQYTIKFGDKNLHKHQRILKDTAIPTIFPHLNVGHTTDFNSSIENRINAESTLKDHQYFGKPYQKEIPKIIPVKVKTDNLVVIDSNIEEAEIESIEMAFYETLKIHFHHDLLMLT